MSHKEQVTFVSKVKKRYPSFFSNKKVLEIGSLNINGSVRDFFEDCTYLGLDLGEGPGVDLVCEGQNFKGDACSFDVSISCECFEHNPEWEQTFINMHRLLKKEGLLVMTCATIGRPEHGTTRTSPKDSPLTISKGWDYYKNLEESSFSIFDLDLMFSFFQFSVNLNHRDLQFVGIKK
jgi:SAM-dependent methyltransferase